MFTGRTVPVQLVPVAEGKVNATYYPKDEGKCKVDVKFANQEVPNRSVVRTHNLVPLGN